MIEVLRAPPFATIQDRGRPGHRAEGVPPSGAMDAPALALLNRLVGNAPGAAGIEWALGPGRVRVAQRCAVAVGPGTVLVPSGQRIPPWTAFECNAGDELSLDTPHPFRFSYLAVSGAVAVPLVLGSRATYLPGRFGGHEGRRLRNGDVLPVGVGSGGDRIGLDAGAPDEDPAGLAVPDYSRPIRVIPGPQASLFDERVWELLEGGAYTVGPVSDRMGYRLEGPAISHSGPAELPSEPACPGAIQVPGGGAPIVLMPDGPTVGGYPKVAVVVTADLGVMAQLVPGARVRFERT
jgi:biotin-dependent carboxylase-like uncharacterized protein